MRYPASEKLEIIRLVERSHLAVGRTLATLGVSRPTFYRWVARYQRLGEPGLEDRRCGPHRRWNRIPEVIRQQVLELALERPELSSRELSSGRCLLYTSPSPRDVEESRMPSSA